MQKVINIIHYTITMKSVQVELDADVIECIKTDKIPGIKIGKS